MSDPIIEPVVVEEPVVVVEPVLEPVVEPVLEPVAVVEDTVIVTLDIKSDTILIPITNTITYNVTSYTVEDLVTVVLNSKAVVNVMFYTDNNITIRRTVELSGADYDAWTSDDDYIYTYVKANVDTIFHSEPIVM